MKRVITTKYNKLTEGKINFYEERSRRGERWVCQCEKYENIYKYYIYLKNNIQYA